MEGCGKSVPSSHYIVARWFSSWHVFTTKNRFSLLEKSWHVGIPSWHDLTVLELQKTTFLCSSLLLIWLKIPTFDSLWC